MGAPPTCTFEPLLTPRERSANYDVLLHAVGWVVNVCADVSTRTRVWTVKVMV